MMKFAQARRTLALTVAGGVLASGVGIVGAAAASAAPIPLDRKATITKTIDARKATPPDGRARSITERKATISDEKLRSVTEGRARTITFEKERTHAEGRAR